MWTNLTEMAVASFGWLPAKWINTLLSRNAFYFSFFKHLLSIMYLQFSYLWGIEYTSQILSIWMDQHNFSCGLFHLYKNVFQQFQKLYCNIFLHFLGSICKVSLYPFQDKDGTVEGLIDQWNPRGTRILFQFWFSPQLGHTIPGLDYNYKWKKEKR